MQPAIPAQERQASPIERVDLDEERFRWRHNEDAMATEKLAEGIRLYNADAEKLAAAVDTPAVPEGSVYN